MAIQRSFEELGTPLSEVTFCIIDLETTGGSPSDDAITEIGALKVKCGEVVGTFHTLVNPGRPVPAFIRLLTGIDDELLIEAPPIEAALPNLVEFVRDSVLVAHNARFDMGFIGACLKRLSYPPLANRVIDTALLARKVLAGEVPNNRLSTLADHLRCAHRPTHRAFEDVLATTDLLHHLFERVAGFGITTLEDLLGISASRLDGTFQKIEMCDALPSGIGVYRFIGNTGKTLYIGKATDLRTRVRSYFYGDSRRRIRNLLREAVRVDAQRFPTLIEAEVAELRAIENERPPYNRSNKQSRAWYVRISASERNAKIAPSRTPKDDGALYLGPVGSMKLARAVVDALRDAAAIHRCAEPRRCSGCAFSDMSRCCGTDRELHAARVKELAHWLAQDPEKVLGALHQRMRSLSSQRRFEEAAEHRDRASLLERLLRKSLRVRSLIEAGDLFIETDRRALLIRQGQLAAATDSRSDRSEAIAELESQAVCEPVSSFFTTPVVREASLILGWLARSKEPLALVHVTGPLALPRALSGAPMFAVSD